MEPLTNLGRNPSGVFGDRGKTSSQWSAALSVRKARVPRACQEPDLLLSTNFGIPESRQFPANRASPKEVA